MNVLITGGCGFLGANVSHGLLEDDLEITVFDNLSRHGAARNLSWLQSAGLGRFVHGDIRCRQDVERAFLLAAPDAVIHLAGQVAMSTSLEDPRSDFEINALGTLNVLESGRGFAEGTGRLLPVFYASTNKVYGDLECIRYLEEDSRYTVPDFPEGFTEDLPLDFRTPYGCSKGAADQMMLDYSRRNVGLACTVFRHSSMYGPRQYATESQGWVGWFCSRAVLARRARCLPFTVSGSGKQVRDLLHCDDMVRLYRSALRRPADLAGKAFNVGGGATNAMSVVELLEWLEARCGVHLEWHRVAQRASDQKVFVACNAALEAASGWRPMVDKEDGLRSMLDWCESIADAS